MNYIIKYEVLSERGATLKAGKMRVRNSNSQFTAQYKLENYLKRKVPFMDRLVIQSCSKENDWSNQFWELFGMKL